MKRDKPARVSSRDGNAKDQTDWVRVRATTDAQLEAAIASDPDEVGMVVDWSKAVLRAKA